MIISPIFNFALDSFRLAHELYFQGGTKLRFSVILLDNCLELSLKELVRHNGGKIFDVSGKSISFYNSIGQITKTYKIPLPEETNFDLLHSTRNDIQHKGANVDETQVEFFLNEVFQFLQRLDIEFFKINLEQVLGEKFTKFFGKPKKVKRAVRRGRYSFDIQ